MYQYLLNKKRNNHQAIAYRRPIFLLTLLTFTACQPDDNAGDGQDLQSVVRTAAPICQAFSSSINNTSVDPTDLDAGPQTIGQYLDCFPIDRMNLLAQKLEPKSEANVDNSNVGRDQVTICTFEPKGISKKMGTTLGDLSNPSPAIYPGSFVFLDEEYLKGTPISVDTGVKRNAFKILIDGLGTDNFPEVAKSTSPLETKGKVDAILDSKIAAFHNSRDKSNVSSGSLAFSVADSKEQLAIDFGLNLGALNLEVKQTETSKTVFVLFKQVYYSVSYAPPSDLEDIFEDNFNTFVQHMRTKGAPIGYLSRVDYGQVLLIQVTTTDKSSLQDLKVNIEKSLKSDVKHDTTKHNVTVEANLYGGNQNAFYGNDTTLEALKKYIKDSTIFNNETVGVPIAYTTSFLGGRDSSAKLASDGQYPSISSQIVNTTYTSEYKEEVCTAYDSGRVELLQN